ncbi:MAG TPA: LUD domain-containing protein [Frankiaceae bacterium]|nr:LUD domain-containing protein [Frankiaceae bacterium]
MTARDEVLARIRAAHEVAPMPSPTIPRGYRTRDGRSANELADLLEERLVDYHATVHRGADLGSLIGSVLEQRHLSSIVLPAGVPEAWRAAIPATVRQLEDDPPLTPTELDEIGGVVTGCRLAIAETGTLVLDGGPDQGRRMLSLVPDYCLAIVRADQIVGSVPEAVAALDPARPLTWVSGPSATSDIELSRVEGVHGPRTLDVVLLG